MIELNKNGVFIQNGVPAAAPENFDRDAGRALTIAYSVMNAHNISDDPKLMRLRFDSLISHDITYVGIIQTA
ncbi:MAG: hypothetical protein HUJ66_04900, partial [Oscillospiraceae bacterium]|nr:hypothetical protein [Oscillospiraceae bacterium]